MAPQAVDYDALAAQHGGTTAAAGPDYDALAAQHGGVVASGDHPMNFAVVNGRRVPVDAPEGVVGKTWDWLNTALVPQIVDAAQAIAEHLDAPAQHRSRTEAQIRGLLAGAAEGAGSVAAGFTSPIGLALTIAGLGPEGRAARSIPALKSMLELPAVQTLQRAVQATSGAGFAAHGAGRMLEAQDLGEFGQGAAELASGVAGTATGVKAALPSRAPVQRLTPEEAASNAFAREHGIPLDAATATGSRTLRAAEKRAANSIGGEGTAERLIAQQNEALARVGGELADEVHPEPVGRVGASEAVRDAVGAHIGLLKGQQDESYARLRSVEADPAHARTVHTAPRGSAAYTRILGKLASGSEDGRAPTERELLAMRQIEAELDAQPFQRGRLVRDNPDTGESHYAPGQPNAAVYHQILQAAPGTADMTGAEVLQGIRRTLETGEWNNASRGAYVLAKRMAEHDAPAPLLPPGTPLLGTTERVGMPVDLAPVQKELRPILDRLLKKKELTGTLRGDEAHALVALDALINGPSVVSLSTADAALSELKAAARGAALPELRTKGQGAAAVAVRELDAAVRQAVLRAGPDAIRALEEGRAATVAKYQLARLYKSLNIEPARAYKAITRPRDEGIELLRKVNEAAPAEVPKIARAYLQELIDRATERGRFDHADRLYAEWQKLGPETKQIMFRHPGVEALDQFFLLAKRVAENPNPSGTAHVNNVFNWVSTVGAYPLAKMLYTTRGVRALSRLLNSTRTPKPALTRAAQVAGWYEVAAAAKAAGVPVPVPVAADSDMTSDTHR